MTELEAVNAVKERAVRAWLLFTQERSPKAALSDWTISHADDGSTILTTRVVGPSAAQYLRLFTSDYPLVLGRPGDQRPAYDYSVPGRVTCVWRSEGVWVELWHPDRPTPKTVSISARPPLAATPPNSSARLSLISRASARLPYTRRKKESTNR